jgi:DNA modification methylase
MVTSETYFLNDQLTMYVGDSLETLKTFRDESVQCCVTSPPYWNLRDYGVDGQLGAEPTPKEYVDNLVRVFDEVKRVLKVDGTFWLNLGDCFCKRNVGNTKQRDLVGIPWLVAFALRDAGWYLRSDIVWNKLNVMPESVRDRPTRSHEFVFLLAKSSSYFYDYAAIKEPVAPKTAERYKYAFGGTKNEELKAGVKPTSVVGTRDVPDTRNKRDVWTTTNVGYKGAHFATFPTHLIEPCILAGSREGDTVLDPFGGAGTTALVCKNLNRKSIYIDLNKDYADMAIKRLGYAE